MVVTINSLLSSDKTMSVNNDEQVLNQQILPQIAAPDVGQGNFQQEGTRPHYAKSVKQYSRALDW